MQIVYQLDEHTQEIYTVSLHGTSLKVVAYYYQVRATTRHRYKIIRKKDDYIAEHGVAVVQKAPVKDDLVERYMRELSNLLTVDY